MAAAFCVRYEPIYSWFALQLPQPLFVFFFYLSFFACILAFEDVVPSFPEQSGQIMAWRAVACFRCALIVIGQVGWWCPDHEVSRKYLSNRVIFASIPDCYFPLNFKSIISQWPTPSECQRWTLQSMLLSTSSPDCNKCKTICLFTYTLSYIEEWSRFQTSSSRDIRKR